MSAKFAADALTVSLVLICLSSLIMSCVNCSHLPVSDVIARLSMGLRPVSGWARCVECEAAKKLHCGEYDIVVRVRRAR